MIRGHNINETDRVTKKAWGENWEKIDIPTILGIFEYPRVKKLMNIVTGTLPGSGRVLEAGCGLGPWVIKLGELGHDVVGIDYQEECVKKINDHCGEEKAFTADIRDIPFGDNTFNAYLSFGVIEHLAEGPEEAIKEAHRVLAKGGRLILFVPHLNIFLRAKAPLNYLKRNSLVRRLFKKPLKDHYYQKYFKVSELESIITDHGFVIEKTMPVDHIFSLVGFSDIFRDKDSYDGENTLAVILGGVLEKVLPWAGAASMLVVAKKG
ncbi:MAG: class I SAM-dependent methyltransferase [Candidatus Omnitrophota bacterium]|nr:class I SAM-dependent methyltransferase [Candidatus Omnitrophota bacterium]